jgi:mono/diheme cytochrome c family protein
MKNLLWIVMLLIAISCQDAETIKFQSYISEGQLLYEQRCANCHQKDGKGLQKLIPPLEGADYLKTHREQLACLIKYGLKGKIIVNGQEYNQLMPANEGLSDRNLTQLLTYINHKWAGEQTRWRDEEVKKMLEKCEKQP